MAKNYTIVNHDDKYITVEDKNGFLDVASYDEHGARYFRDVWGVPRWPLLTCFGVIQLV